MSRIHPRANGTSLVRVTLAFLLVAQANCSFVFSRPLADGYSVEQGKPKCRGYGPAWADAGIGSGLLALGGLLALPPAENSSTRTDERYRKAELQIAKGLTVAAIGLGLSAIYGMRKGRKCRNAVNLWTAEQKRQEAAKDAEQKRQEAAKEARIDELRKARIKSTDLRISNNYAESLFSVSIYLPDTDETIEAPRRVRVQPGETVVLSGAIQARVGQPFSIEIRAMSLGNERSFWFDYEKLASHWYLHVLYDWDPAIAEFRLRSQWVKSH